MEPLIDDIKEVWESCEVEELRDRAEYVVNNAGAVLKMDDEVANGLIDKFIANDQSVGCKI